MARFKFFLMGRSDAPIMEMENHNLESLQAVASASRYLIGDLVENDTTICRVLISTAKIQLVAEADI